MSNTTVGADSKSTKSSNDKTKFLGKFKAKFGPLGGSSGKESDGGTLSDTSSKKRGGAVKKSRRTREGKACADLSFTSSLNSDSTSRACW